MAFIANLLPFNVLLGVLCFPGDLFYFPSEIELEFCLPTLSHRSMAAPCLKQAIRRQGEGKMPGKFVSEPQSKRKVPLPLCFASCDFPLTILLPYSANCLIRAWESGENKLRVRWVSQPFSVLRAPFLTSWTKIRVLFQELFVCTWVPLLGFLV